MSFEACNGGTIFLDEIGDMSPMVLGITRGKIRDRVRQFGITMDKTVASEE